MTDNEIIKALEFCTCRTKIVCQECPYNINYTECMGLTMKQDALNLINRQKAEIERLKKTIKSYEKTRRAYQRYVRGNGWEYLWDVAIKEFAERLKNELELEDAETWFEIYECGLIREIDNLVKEMTEEQK